MKKKSLLPISARGQSLVELAISLVVLLYLLAGAAEFAIALFQYVQLRDAAQEGALYGSIHPTDTAGIITRARNSSSSPINLQNPAVTIDIYIDDDPTEDDDPLDTVDDIPYTDADYADKACEGHGVKVVVSYDHTVFMPFMPRIIGDTIELKATVTDTILTPPPDPAAPAGFCN